MFENIPIIYATNGTHQPLLPGSAELAQRPR